MTIIAAGSAGDAPCLRMLGPVRLEGAKGPPPGRARLQLEEMCAWLLEHPRCTPRQLAEGLALAEGTRRSNLSRLRAWLGDDADGRPYLPRAYSGLIALDGVTSDWGRFRALLGPGAAHTPTNALADALSLVRGPVLCDVPPGHWPWADELRADATRLIEQTALELADRTSPSEDDTVTRWSLHQGLLADPGSEEIRSRWPLLRNR